MKDLINVYMLLFTQGISLIGSRVTGIALGIWLFSITGKTSYILFVPLFNEIPSLIFGHFVGVVVDKIDRKKAIVLGDLGQAAGTTILLSVLILDRFSPWILFMVVFVQGFFSMIQEVGADSAIAVMVDEANIQKINGVKEMMYPAAGIIAPAITGIFYPLIGLKGVIVMDLVSFLVAVTIVSFLKIRRCNSREDADSYRESYEKITGFQYLKKEKIMLQIVVYYGLTNFLINGPLELVVPYVMAVTKNEVWVSIILASMGIATFIGGGIVAFSKRIKNLEKLIMGCMILNGCMLVCFGIFRKPALLCGVIFLGMIPLPIVSALFRLMLQTRVPEDIQGRVFAVAYQIAFGITPLSFLITGPIVDNILEPGMQKGSWFLSSIFGAGEGSGIGVMISLAGILTTAASVIGIVKLRRGKK